MSSSTPPSRRARTPLGRLSRLAVAGVLLAALCSCSQGTKGSVTLLLPWSGGELQTFQDAVITPFENESGIHVDVESTRALDQVLAADTERGDPPELAIVPTPQTIASYWAKGSLYSLSSVIGADQWSHYDPRWTRWVQFKDADGKTRDYGAFIKVTISSIIWYDPKDTAHPAPTTWSQLLALGSPTGQTPWCLGMAQTPVSGWPGTHWIEDILLHEFGAAVYSQWVNGTLPWDSGPVEQAWKDWMKILGGGSAVYGGGQGAVLTEIGNAGRPMLTAQPSCYFDHEGSFAEAIYAGDPGVGGAVPKPVADFDFARFPATGQGSASDLIVAGDLVGMFRDTPQAEALARYLVSDKAQQSWAGSRGSGVNSLDSAVTPDSYSDPLARRVASIIRGPGTFCFGASDLMPADLRADFYQAVLEYLQAPQNLLTILSELQKAQDQANGQKLADTKQFECGN